MSGPALSPSLSPDEVRRSLERILESREFVLSGRLSRFLRLVVEKQLSGQAHQIKEAVIGVEVFEKAPGYDPKLEPIVRVEAHRLRRKLQSYYSNSGKHDLVRIEIPTGSYVPVFRLTGNNGGLPKRAVLSRRGGLLVAGLAAAVLVAAGLVWQQRSLRAVSRLVAPLVPVPLTTDPGMECAPSFSPDGRRIAFQRHQSLTGQDMDIYIKEVRGESMRRLTFDSRPDFSPAWSPDGASIAFLRDIGNLTSEVRLISIDDNAPERLLFTTWTGRRALAFADTYLTWTPDGKALITPGRESGKPGLFLYRVPDGSRTRLTEPEEENTLDRSPSVSPDGRFLAFNRAADWARRRTCTAPLAAGPPYKANCSTAGGSRVHSAAWTRDGRELLFVRGPFNGSAIWRARPHSLDTANRLNLTEQSAYQPALSVRGNRLAYVKVSLDLEIWQFPIENGAAVQSKGRRWLQSSRFMNSPAHSPDGTKVVFQTGWTGTPELWVSGHDGGNPKQLTRLNASTIQLVSWSPAGSWIAFTALPDKDWELFVLDINSDQPPRRIAALGAGTVPEWTRDGKALLASTIWKGKTGLFRFNLEGNSAPALLVEGAAGGAGVSADGRFLYFKMEAEGPIRRKDLISGNEIVVTTGRSDQWFRLGRSGVYFVTSGEGASRLMFQQFGSRSPELVLPRLAASFSVSPDEKTLLAVQPGNANADLMLVEGFR